MASVVNAIKPNLIIHTAGLANVDACENNKHDALNINVRGTENIAMSSNNVGAKLVYISTDSVFDGTKGDYIETDATKPLNIYAISKLAGEHRIMHLAPDSIIVRTAFYGLSRYDSGLAKWILDSILRGKCINMFTDTIFTPIYVDNLTEVIMSMYHNNLNGIYHVGGSEACSKSYFGRVIADAFGFNKNLVRPISIDEAQLVATRPKNTSLNTDKVQVVQDVKLMDVRAGIFHLRKRWYYDE